VQKHRYHKENKEAVLEARREVGLEVKQIKLSICLCHFTKKSLKNVSQFKCPGTAVTN
jgi:hypothetical protein